VDRGAKKVLSIRGDDEDPRSRGYICPKALAVQGIYEDPDRIRLPLRRTNGGWEEISWEQAFDEITKRLRTIRETHGNDAIATYIGNPTGHNYGAMLYTTFFMQALGSNQLYSGSSVDQFPKNLSCNLLYGDSWLFPIPDIERTDFLIVLGANPVISNGSILSAPDMKGRLRSMRERGAKVVVIDPRRTETADAANQHLFIRPGSDALFLFSFLHVLFAEELVKLGRLETFSDGLDRVRELAQKFPPEAVADATGIDPQTLRQLALAFATTKRAVLYGRFGTCTQEFGTLASWLVDLVNILTGHFDEPGGLMFPRAATGQTEPVAQPNPPLSYGEFHSTVRGFPKIDGLMPVAVMAEEIDSAGEKAIRAMITVAGNPVLTTPNGDRLGKALDQLELMVAVDIYLNETTKHAHFILPSTVQLEHENFDFMFSTTSVRNMVHYSPQVFEPEPDAKHHWQILLELAARLNSLDIATLENLMFEGSLAMFLGKSGTAGANVSAQEAKAKLGAIPGPERLLDLMLRAGPYGDGFDDAVNGLSLAKLKESKHAIDLGPLQPRLPDVLRTPSRRIQLAPELIVGDVERLQRALARDRKAEGFLLVSRRQIQNMNSWLHNLEVLAKGKNRCTLEIHPDDAKRIGLADRGTARVSSRVGMIEVEVEVSDRMMPGVVCLPHGYGHTKAGTRLHVASSKQPGSNYNQLADELLLDEISGTSVINGLPVDVNPA